MDKSPDDLSQYLEAVENLAQIKSSLCFRNSNQNHAAIVMSTIIKTSKNEVRIYDNDLKGDLTDIYPEMLNSINSYVKKGNVLKIVLKDVTKSDSNIYNLLHNLSIEQPNNIQVKKASDEFIESLTKALKGSFYFMTGDNCAFRIEVTSDKRKAYCCFNNLKIASRFNNIFDLYFSECQNAY